MLQQSIWFGVLAIGANALAYVYQLAMARMLEPHQYSMVLALVSFIAILLFPGNAFQAAVAVGTGRIVEWSGHSQVWRFVLRAGLSGVVAASAVATMFFLFAAGLQNLFGFDGLWVVTWLAIGLVLSLGLSAMRGAMQGMQQFARLGMVMLGEAALRLIVAAVLVAMGFGVAGATAGFAIGYFGALGLAVWWLRSGSGGEDGCVPSTHLWRVLREQVPAAWAAFGVFGVQAIDVVVANAQLPADQLEAYSAAALAGRIMFWAGFVLSLLVLPKFREMFPSHLFDRALVGWAFGALMVLLGGVLVIGFTVPGILHLLLVGSRYAQDPVLMQTYLVGSAFLTLALLLTYILIAAGWHRVWTVLVPVALGQTLAYVLWAESAMEFAQVLVLGGAALAVVTGIPTALLLRGVKQVEGSQSET